MKTRERKKKLLRRHRSCLGGVRNVHSKTRKSEWNTTVENTLNSLESSCLQFYLTAAWYEDESHPILTCICHNFLPVQTFHTWKLFGKIVFIPYIHASIPRYPMLSINHCLCMSSIDKALKCKRATFGWRKKRKKIILREALYRQLRISSDSLKFVSVHDFK